MESNRQQQDKERVVEGRRIAAAMLTSRPAGPVLDPALGSSTSLSPSSSSSSTSTSTSLGKMPIWKPHDTHSEAKSSRSDSSDYVSSLPKLRLLRPKGSLTSPQQDVKHPTPPKPPRTCRVKSCSLTQCRLRTHQQYRRSRPLTWGPEIDDTNHAQTDMKDHELQHNRSEHSSPVTRLSAGVDGLPALPLDGLDDRVFRELFHFFFGYQYDKIIRLLFPPPVSKFQKLTIERNKERALTSALSAPVYCLHYIACTHHQMVFRKDHRCPDKNTGLLYGKVNALLRVKLNDYGNADAEDLILVIFTLVMFEMTGGRTQSLALHRRAVEHLVASHGGVHYMGRAIPFVLNLDRIFSIMLYVPPLYATANHQLPRKPSSIAPSYGAFLQDPFSELLLGVQAFQYVEDVCRAIEIAEEEQWSFDPSDPPNKPSANLHYLFFLRDCAANQFVVLNSSMATDQTVSRCIILVTKIVEYETLMDSYIIAIPLEIANKVQEIVHASDSPIDWDRHDTILTWMLFVLTCASIPWEGRRWAIALLQKQLNLKHRGSSWPQDWRQLELQHVRRFVWSDVRFNTQFTKTCNELLSDSP